MNIYKIEKLDHPHAYGRVSFVQSLDSLATPEGTSFEVRITRLNVPASDAMEYNLCVHSLTDIALVLSQPQNMNIISAVRLVRSLTGCGLREAKDFVDALRA